MKRKISRSILLTMLHSVALAYPQEQIKKPREDWTADVVEQLRKNNPHLASIGDSLLPVGTPIILPLGEVVKLQKGSTIIGVAEWYVSEMEWWEKLIADPDAPMINRWKEAPVAELTEDEVRALKENLAKLAEAAQKTKNAGSDPGTILVMSFLLLLLGGCIGFAYHYAKQRRENGYLEGACEEKEQKIKRLSEEVKLTRAMDDEGRRLVEKHEAIAKERTLALKRVHEQSDQHLTKSIELAMENVKLKNALKKANQSLAWFGETEAIEEILYYGSNNTIPMHTFAPNPDDPGHGQG